MSFARGLMAQLEVVHALALRETRTRFGKHQLGYLWALLEPTMMILTFFILFEIAHRTVPNGMDLFGFITTGIIPYLTFRESGMRVADAVKSNKGMLFYPHVNPLDLVFARSMLELCTFGAVFVALMGANVLHLQRVNVDSALLIVSGMVLASLLGTAFGLVLCMLSQFSNAVERARGPLIRPLFWTSGIFFTANEVPGKTREYLLYNPVLHVVEIVRDGWYPNYDSRHAEPTYVLVWILGFALVGLSLEKVVRRRIEVT